MVKKAFNEAAEMFVQTVDRIAEDRWDSPALGEWILRDLVGHTLRALVTVENYSATPGTAVDLHRPADYFLRAFEALADPAAVAQRGRDAGKDLGNQPVDAVRETASRVKSTVAQLPDDSILATPVGGIRLIDYLPTRIFELVVHTLDISSATGLEVPPPAEPLRVTLHLLADLAVDRGNGPIIALATTGRCSLPEGFSLLG